MWVWEHGLDWSGSQQGQVVGFCECGNEPSSSIICRKLLEWLSLSKRTLLHGISCLVTCLVAAQNICKIQWSWTVQTVKLHCANSTALWTEFVQIMQTHFTKWIICSRCLRGGTVRWSNPGGGEIFRTCQNRPWDPPSLLHNRYRGFPGGKKKSKAIPLLPLRTFMACYGGTFTLSNWFILPTFPKSPMIRLIASNDSKIDKRWAQRAVLTYALSLSRHLRAETGGNVENCQDRRHPVTSAECRMHYWSAYRDIPSEYILCNKAVIVSV